MNSHYALDKPNAKLLGVCSGVSRSTGWDPTAIRIGTVLSLLLLGPITILLYVVTGLIAESR